MIEFHFFGMPIKTLGSLGKIRVGRVTGNTHISFFGLIDRPSYMVKTLQKSSSPEPAGRFSRNLVCSIGDSSLS